MRLCSSNLLSQDFSAVTNKNTFYIINTLFQLIVKHCLRPLSPPMSATHNISGFRYNEEYLIQGAIAGRPWNIAAPRQSAGSCENNVNHAGLAGLPVNSCRRTLVPEKNGVIFLLRDRRIRTSGT
ncbi:MAG: hypothetical protein ACOCUC_02405, partial [bacterium]